MAASAAGDWTVVRHRGHRNRTSPTAHPETPRPLPLTPHPWSPSDPSLDASRVSRLLSRAHAAVSRVAGSRLYRRLLLLLPRRLLLLSPTRLVVLGVGNFESSLPARLQLALACLLRCDVLPPASPCDLFDPVLSAVECAAAAALGFSIPRQNDGCRRRAEEPTLFYMPHCEVTLYDALLAANWCSPAQLRRVCVLGNSFRWYACQAADDAAGPAAAAAHVLAAERYAWEVGIDDVEMEEEENGFGRAFNETSWHFFEIDDGVDLDAAVAAARRR